MKKFNPSTNMKPKPFHSPDVTFGVRHSSSLHFPHLPPAKNSTFKIRTSSFSFFGRFLRGDDDSHELVDFSPQSFEFRLEARVNAFRSELNDIWQKLQPKLRFIRFFFDDSEFCHEFRSRPGAARCSVVRSNGTARAQQLSTDMVHFESIRQLCAKREDIYRKALRAVLQVIFHPKILSFESHQAIPKLSNCAHIVTLILPSLDIRNCRSCVIRKSAFDILFGLSTSFDIRHSTFALV